MAEYYDPEETEGLPEPRRRRLLTMHEMTGNPFLQGSPYATALRQNAEQPERPRFAPPTEEDPAMPELAEQRAVSTQLRGAPAPAPPPPSAAATSLASIPTQGPQAQRAAPVAQTKDYRAPVHAAMRSLQNDMQMPDMTQQAEGYRRRYEEAGPDLALGMMMADRGGESGRQFGGQIFKQALARRQPEKTDYGTFDQSGFTADPMKEREFKILRGERQIALLETIARDSENADERKAARLAANQLRADAMQMHREKLSQGKFAHVLDPESGQVLIYDTHTGKPVEGGGVGGRGGGPGGAPGEPRPYPERVSPKATEDERRIASNVRRIVGSAGLMTPGGAAPGVVEAATRQIPYVGEGVAAGVRGASGTMGIGDKSRQSTYQSQADIVDALLYISTGAAYNKEQLQTMREAYMPAWTDNAKARKDKTTRLKTMIEAAKVRAGRAWTREAEEALNAAMPGLTGEGAAIPETNFPRATAPQGNTEARANSYVDRIRQSNQRRVPQG